MWWVLVASLGAYVVVAHVVEVSPRAGLPTPLLVPIFGAISIAIGIGTFVYRRRTLAEPIQAGSLDPSTPEGMQVAFPPFMLNLVLSESVGIYGLVLTFLSGQPLYTVAFCAAAVGLMYVHRPTAPDLQPPLSAHR